MPHAVDRTSATTPTVAGRFAGAGSTAATITVASASIAIGSAAIFLRPLNDVGLAPIALAFFRYAITAVMLLPALDLRASTRSATCWGLAGGAAAGLGWIAYADAVTSADLATTGVAYMTYPVFALLASRILFGRDPGARSILGGLIVVLAAAIALGPTALLGVSPVLFVAPATFGLSISILTDRLGALEPSARLAAVALGAALVLTPLLLTLPPAAVIPTTWTTSLLLLGVAIGCGFVPMWVYGAVAPTLGSARTSVAGAIELPTMFVIGAVVFGEAIQPEHLVAGGLIVASVVLTPSKRLPGIAEQVPSAGGRQSL